MAGPEAVHAAEGGGHPHRAACIGAQGEVDQTGGDGHRRAAGGAARQSARAGRILRRAVVCVGAFQAEGEFVADRASRHAGAGRQQPGRGEPVRITAAGGLPGHVDQVFYGEAQAVERSAAAGGELGAGTGQERPRPSHQPRVRVTSASITAVDSVTKPKHFFTFHTVASVQKSGEVVAQQSSTRMQP